MTNTILLRQLVAVCTFMVMGFVVPTVSLAMGSDKESEKVNSQADINEQSHYFWYDGDQKRSVWVNPKLVAEFNPKPETSTQLKSLYGAEDIAIQSSSYVRFWALDSETLKDAVVENHKREINSQLSPVLHDSASTSGTKKALPGNVLVQMKPEWSQAQIDTWFKEQRLIVIKPLTFAPNAFLVQSEPGLESLNTANRIYETGDVILASPNWWQEVYPQ